MRCSWKRIVPISGVLLALAAGGFAQRQGLPPLKPDPVRTPGDALDVTRDDVCMPGYTKMVRNVPSDVKKQVYSSYGIRRHAAGEFEIDHLISLELGGSNSVKNLWPQSYRSRPWNAHLKDRLENRLHADVCSGKLDLKAAQQMIANDWIGTYNRLLGGPGRGARRSTGRTLGRTPRSAPRSRADDPGSGAAADRVWVNTRSGKYFLPGGRYYGKTKEGRYMSETEARSQGYVPAGGR